MRKRHKTLSLEMERITKEDVFNLTPFWKLLELLHTKIERSDRRRRSDSFSFIL